jgi:Protein of unknown function (DUF2628).
MFCKECGNKILDVEGKFCTNCGAPIVHETNRQPVYVQSNNAESQPQNQNPYANSYNNQNSDPQWDQPQRLQDMATFIGKKAPYYIASFKKMKFKKGNISWNWGAFIFTTCWLFYRKMYKVGGILLGFDVLTSLLEVLTPKASYRFSSVNLGIAVAMGLFGNRIYMEHVEKELKLADSLDAHQREQYLSTRGGTNIGAVVGIAILLLILTIICEAFTN